MFKVAREIRGPQPLMTACMIQTMSLALKSIAGVFSDTNEKSDKGFMTSETGDCHLGCAILVRAVGWALINVTSRSMMMFQFKSFRLQWDH